jgi:hypothetical protein
VKAAYATFSAIHVHEGGATFSEHGFSMAFSIPDKAETLLLAAMMADLYRASAERRKCDLQKLSQSLRINCSRVFSAFEHAQKSNVSQCTRVFIYIYIHTLFYNGTHGATKETAGGKIPGYGFACYP